MILAQQQHSTTHSAHSNERHGVKELFASLKRLRSSTNHSRSSATPRDSKPLPLPPTPASSPFPSPRPPSPPSPRDSPPLQPLQRPTRGRQESLSSSWSANTWTAAYQSGRLDWDASPPLFHDDVGYMPPTPPAEAPRPRSLISVASTGSRGSSPMTPSTHFGALTAEPRPYLASPATDGGRERFSIHLETVTEGKPLEQEASAEQLKFEMEALARGRRPSLALSVESCPNELAGSDVPPLVLRRTGNTGYSPATPITIPIPASLSSCFDITTQQCAELLNLDFVALIAVSSSSALPTLSVLSSHNMPIPPPLYNISTHADMLQQGTHAVAYTSPCPSPTEFASGLILKIKSSCVRDIGFLLVGYSFSEQVHTLEELSGMEHFARDIRVGLDKL